MSKDFSKILNLEFSPKDYKISSDYNEIRFYHGSDSFILPYKPFLTVRFLRNVYPELFMNMVLRYDKFSDEVYRLYFLNNSHLKDFIKTNVLPCIYIDRDIDQLTKFLITYNISPGDKIRIYGFVKSNVPSKKSSSSKNSSNDNNSISNTKETSYIYVDDIKLVGSSTSKFYNLSSYSVGLDKYLKIVDPTFIPFNDDRYKFIVKDVYVTDIDAITEFKKNDKYEILSRNRLLWYVFKNRYFYNTDFLFSDSKVVVTNKPINANSFHVDLYMFLYSDSFFVINDVNFKIPNNKNTTSTAKLPYDIIQNSEQIYKVYKYGNGYINSNLLPLTEMYLNGFIFDKLKNNPDSDSHVIEFDDISNFYIKMNINQYSDKVIFDQAIQLGINLNANIGRNIVQIIYLKSGPMIKEKFEKLYGQQNLSEMIQLVDINYYKNLLEYLF